MNQHKQHEHAPIASEPAYAFANVPAHPQKVQSRAKFIAALAMLGCMSFAMLIWYKLRVVTNVPRTAYAEPEQKPAEDKPVDAEKKTPGMTPGSR